MEVVYSSGGHMVWARDSRQGVWARVGVYPDLPLGTGWVPVTGLAVTRLALSRTSVWALALSGQVYRRTGLSSWDIRQLELRETQVSPPVDAAGTEGTDLTVI